MDKIQPIVNAIADKIKTGLFPNRFDKLPLIVEPLFMPDGQDLMISGKNKINAHQKHQQRRKPS